jgi:hypothetical protein
MLHSQPQAGPVVRQLDMQVGDRAETGCISSAVRGLTQTLIKLNYNAEAYAAVKCVV